MTIINAATKAILNGTKSPVPTTADMKGALGAVYDVLSECGILNGTTAFQVSKATRGYQKLPSGLILQWGQDATASNGILANTFPIPFPSGTLSVVASITSGTGGTFGVNLSSFTSSGFTAVTNQGNAPVQAGFSWIAIGY